MMGPRQEAQAALFYEFSLEDHVPQDHLLRSIECHLDLSSFVAQIRCRAGFPFPRTDLSYGRCAGYAKSGVAVENGDADLDFRDLPIKVSCH